MDCDVRLHDEEWLKKVEEHDKELEEKSNRFIVEFAPTRGVDLKAQAKNIEDMGRVLRFHNRISLLKMT